MRGKKNSLSYQYDELNRQTQVTNHTGDVFTCDYNAVGNMTAINYPDGTQSVREFDEENRITKVANDHPFSDPPQTPPHIEYDYTYDEVGNFASVQKTPGDLSPRQYQYDPTYKLTRDESANKDFLYDNAGNKTRESIGSGHFIHFSYNSAHQLTRRYASVGAGIPEINYNYDNSGNRKRRYHTVYTSGEESIASFTPTNRLKEVKYYESFMPMSKLANSHSGSGFPTATETKGSRQTGTESRIEHYAYDGGEELFWSESRGDSIPIESTDAKNSGTNALVKTIKNAYQVESSSGKKYLKLPKLDNYNYIFTNSFHGYESGVLLYKKGVMSIVMDGVTAPTTWNKIEYYTYLNGMKVGVYIDDEGGFFPGGASGLYSFYFSYDGQGNVVQVSNKAGQVPYHLYAYDSYGSTTEVEGHGYYRNELASYKGYDKGPFGYKTGVRQYDPETGSFLSPDAFKGYMTDPASQHPYMYCRGNPVRYSDPSGYKDFIIYSKPGREGKMHELIARTHARKYKNPVISQASSIEDIVRIIGKDTIDTLIIVAHGAPGMLFLSMEPGEGNVAESDVPSLNLKFKRHKYVQVKIYACNSARFAKAFADKYKVRSLGIKTTGEYSGKEKGQPGKGLPDPVPENYKGPVYMVPASGRINDFITY